MPLTLRPSEVARNCPNAPAVSPDLITAAAEIIHHDLERTVDEFVTAGVSEAAVKIAWSVVAGRLGIKVSGVGTEAVTSETDNDFNYAESVTLAEFLMFQSETDGVVRKLLNVPSAHWLHI